ncbi:hypothetical protein HK102_004341 [Quaeritorhiza haematococci]|nr:hypothetical protein HK102_004341 [Quaeritorhiza haematococci]
MASTAKAPRKPTLAGAIKKLRRFAKKISSKLGVKAHGARNTSGDKPTAETPDISSPSHRTEAAQECPHVTEQAVVMIATGSDDVALRRDSGVEMEGRGGGQESSVGEGVTSLEPVVEKVVANKTLETVSEATKPAEKDSGDTWIDVLGKKRSTIAAERTKLALPEDIPWAVSYMGPLPLVAKLTHEIVGDGNCFCRALAKHLHGSQDEHLKVREAIVKELKQNRSLYDWEVGAEDRTQALRSLKQKGVKVDEETMDDWTAYVEAMAIPGVYVEGVFIRAAARCFDIPICIFMEWRGWKKYREIQNPWGHGPLLVLWLNKYQHYEVIMSHQSTWRRWLSGLLW